MKQRVGIGGCVERAEPRLLAHVLDLEPQCAALGPAQVLSVAFHAEGRPQWRHPGERPVQREVLTAHVVRLRPQGEGGGRLDLRPQRAPGQPGVGLRVFVDTQRVGADHARLADGGRFDVAVDPVDEA